jgi:hypothetical protein
VSALPPGTHRFFPLNMGQIISSGTAHLSMNTTACNFANRYGFPGKIEIHGIASQHAGVSVPEIKYVLKE